MDVVGHRAGGTIPAESLRKLDNDDEPCSDGDRISYTTQRVLLLLVGEVMGNILAKTGAVANGIAEAMFFVFLMDNGGLVGVSRDLVNIDMGLGCLDQGRQTVSIDD